jgi:hypothetical protein
MLLNMLLITWSSMLSSMFRGTVLHELLVRHARIIRGERRQQVGRQFFEE